MSDLPWIEWNGGECPVDGYVCVVLRGGVTGVEVAQGLKWSHKGVYLDIVRYYPCAEDGTPLTQVENIADTSPPDESDDWMEAEQGRKHDTVKPRSKYHMENLCKGVDEVDYYRVMDIFRIGRTRQIGDSAVEHAIKKLLIPGERGAKGRIQDLEEAVRSIKEAIKMVEESEK